MPGWFNNRMDHLAIFYPYYEIRGRHIIVNTYLQYHTIHQFRRRSNNFKTFWKGPSLEIETDSKLYARMEQK
jgi:hypothetical protein